ncbi:hypothetical protein WICPIJ_002697 [Wickerhamomyces pijperi]|uniref:Anaphase-promoting complex subunit 4 WD40 domain-containing protein n=1 Tax=Wickerhamomyces pijperi TaxID=599730 RepID=A0A9P8QB92_WICPI|nr:hypothetical protein WICPIJ_002697 [Wickerhamomyces pijperi]
MASIPQFNLLPHPPTTDLISAVKFTPRPSLPLLLCSTWDGDITLYDTSSLTQLTTVRNGNPVLDLEWDDSGRESFFSDVKGDIKKLDFENSKYETISLGGDKNGHTEGVKCLKWMQGRLCSGSWDKSVKMWDIRSSANIGVETIQLDEKVISMDSTGYKLVMSCTASTNYIYDVRNVSIPLTRLSSPGERQTRRLKCLPNGEGFLQSTIDSRCCVEFFADPEKSYAFRCHRHTDENKEFDVSYPVNALTFHPRYQTLFTGGSDGLIYLWNWEKRKRIKQFADFNGNSVLAMDSKGDTLVVATGDDSYRTRAKIEGYDPKTCLVKPSRIYVREMESNEGKPSVKGRK